MGETRCTAQSHLNQIDQFCYSVKKTPLYLCMEASSLAGKMSLCVHDCGGAGHACKKKKKKKKRSVCSRVFAAGVGL